MKDSRRSQSFVEYIFGIDPNNLDGIDRFRRNVVVPIGFFGMGICTTLFGDLSYSILQHELGDPPQLSTQVQIRKGVNQDGFISHQEWFDVYKIVRSHDTYDSRNPPSHLSIAEMEGYLERQK